MTGTDVTDVTDADWSDPRFALPAIAPHTGPFPKRAFLEAWWSTRSREGDELLIVATGEALLPLFVNDGVVRFCGEADLTDYHSPLGSDSSDLIEAATRGRPGSTIDFDSLPIEAAIDLIGAMAGLGSTVDVERHATAAVIRLPPSADEWMTSLGKKARHEVRRKARRFTADLGEPDLARQVGDVALETFFSMHQAAAGEKGAFMTPAMETFFRELHATAGATIDILSVAGRPVAAAFGFECEGAYYLYNSAYDPTVGSASPGIVMLIHQIERQIERRATIFDFLKGDERYKYRLGAEARPLFRIRGSLP